MAISSKASEVASARGAMLTPAGRGAASGSCPSCPETQRAPRGRLGAAHRGGIGDSWKVPCREREFESFAHGCTAQRMATDAKVQAKDLGGLGSASGEMPRGGGASRSRKGSEVVKSGMKHGSAARAAPQQAIPAAPPQQWPPQSVNTPTATGPEARAVLGAVTFATGTAAFLTAPVSDNGGTTFAARSG